jgi:hypothetical protein
MGLRRGYTKRFKGVSLKSGHFYTFKYQPWEHDPKPVIIFMHTIEGINEKANGKLHEWRFIQAINFTYVPRGFRKRFLKIWLKELEKPGKPKFHWQKVLAKYPYLKPGIRRYFLKPSYYITNLKEVPFDEIEKVVISTLSKDFSKKITTALKSKFKKAMKFRLSFRKKKKKKKKRR